MSQAAVSLVVLAALAAPAGAYAQDSRWERQVRDQLRRYGSTLTDRGYKITREVRTGSLDDKESEAFALTLEAGRSYALLGVCDEDCTDVDLRLFDEDGDEIDADVQDHDYPVVEITPRITQGYRVRVIMATCRTSPCYYGVGVFGK